MSGSQGLPPLTEEERRVLSQTKREALMYRSLPLIIVNDSLLLMAFRRGFMTTRSWGAKVSAIGTVTVLSYFTGMASYGSEFRRRLRELEHSPLRDLMEAKSGVHSQYQFADTRQNSRADSQHFVAGNTFAQSRDDDSYGSYFDSNQRVNIGNQRNTHDLPSNNRFNNPDNYNPNRNLDSNYGFSNYSNNAPAPQSNNQFAPPVETHVNSSAPPNGRRYMSYQERRKYYRDHPGERGQMDPFGKFNRPVQQPNGRNTVTDNPLNRQPSDGQYQQSEKPFVPFFNEPSIYSDDRK